MRMPSPVKLTSRSSKSPSFRTDSTRFSQSTREAGGNSEVIEETVIGDFIHPSVATARGGRESTSPLDVPPKPRNRACHLFHQILTGLFLGEAQGFRAQLLDLFHIETRGVKLADGRERSAHEPAAQLAEKAAAARAVAAIAIGKLRSARQPREQFGDLLLIALGLDQRQHDAERLLGACGIEPGFGGDSR